MLDRSLLQHCDHAVLLDQECPGYGTPGIEEERNTKNLIVTNQLKCSSTTNTALPYPGLL